MTKETKYPATLLVFWPGQDVRTCEKHYQRLVGWNAMTGGGHLASEKLKGDYECRYCKSERHYKNRCV